MESYEYTVSVTHDSNRQFYQCVYKMKYSGVKVSFTTNRLLKESELLKEAKKAYDAKPTRCNFIYDFFSGLGIC